ncbi:MAG: hypothetical protein JXR07_20345 [Reichenbachiella sp.]
MKNKLEDLNNHLFAQLEKLGEDDLKGDALREEIERARAISGISKQITHSAKLTLEAAIFVRSSKNDAPGIPKTIGGSEDEVKGLLGLK